MYRNQIRMFDLFCGGGGSSLGAVLAGANPVGALDSWELAAKAYKLNFPAAKVYNNNASNLSPHRIIGEIGKIDLLIASPECTNHSVARGSKPRCEKSRATAFEVIRFVKVLKPRWIVVENVLQMQRWNRFSEWYRELTEFGYKIETGILNAKFYDTPQSRRRFFMVGDREAKPHLPNSQELTKKTVSSIIGFGECLKKPWRFSPLFQSKRAEATKKRANRAIDELGTGVPFILIYYGTDGAGGFQSIDRPLRTITTIDRFAYVRPNGNGYEMRMLQPPELSAAMGFPKFYTWPKSTRRDRIKLIGNAVCPSVMKAVVNTLVNK